MTTQNESYWHSVVEYQVEFLDKYHEKLMAMAKQATASEGAGAIHLCSYSYKSAFGRKLELMENFSWLQIREQNWAPLNLIHNMRSALPIRDDEYIVKFSHIVDSLPKDRNAALAEYLARLANSTPLMWSHCFPRPGRLKSSSVGDFSLSGSHGLSKSTVRGLSYEGRIGGTNFTVGILYDA